MQWTDEAIAEAKRLYESGLSMKSVADLMGVPYSAVDRMFKRINYKVRGSGPPTKKGDHPPGIEALYAELKSVKAVADHYSVNIEVAYRWLGEARVKLFGARIKPLAIPDDWHDVAPRMTQAELMRHYNCGRERIYKLMAVTGVHPIKYTDKPPKEKTVREITPKVVRSSLDKPREDLSHLTTKAEAAAHYLRRYYANVFKADIRYTDIGRETWGFREGLPNGGRHQYSVSGVGVLWLDELIELAEKRGWKEPLI